MQNFLFSLVFALLLVIPSFAQEPSAPTDFSFVGSLPAETIAFFGFPDMPAARAGFEKSNLANLLAEKEFQNFLEPFRAHLDKEIKLFLEQAEQKLGFSATAQKELLNFNQLLVAMLDVDVSNPMKPIPSIVLSIENRKDANQYWEMIQKMADLSVEEHEIYGGMKIWTSPKLPLYFGVFHHSFLVANQKAALEQLWLAHSTKADGRLVQNPEVLALIKKLVPENEACFLGGYINFQRILSIASNFMTPEIAANLQKLGIFDIQSIAFASNFSGNQMHSSFILHAPGAKTGIHSFYQGKKLNITELANQFPSNVIGFSSSGVSLVALLERLEEIAELLDPDESQGLLLKLQTIVRLLEMQFGLSIKEDLGTAFAAPIASCSFFAGSGLLPDNITLIPILNQPKAEQCISQLAKLLDLQIKELPRNPKIFYLSAPLKAFGSDPFSDLENVNPIQSLVQSMTIGFSGYAFTYLNGSLCLATSTQALEIYLDWKQAPGQVSLAQNDNFQNMLNLAPSHCLAVMYMDYREVLDRWLDTSRVILRTFEGLTREFGIPLDTALLPRAKTLGKHLGIYSATISLEPQGLMLSFRGSLDIMGILAGTAGTAGLTAILLDAVAPKTPPQIEPDIEKPYDDEEGALIPEKKPGAMVPEEPQEALEEHEDLEDEEDEVSPGEEEPEGPPVEEPSIVPTPDAPKDIPSEELEDEEDQGEPEELEDEEENEDLENHEDLEDEDTENPKN